MKTLACLILVLSGSLFAANAPVPSGVLKAFTGPEGEVVAMVEVNGAKEMLVHFQNISPEIDGTARLYTIEEEGSNRAVTYQVKKGSKMKTHYIAEYRANKWKFFNPAKAGSAIDLKYSKDETAKLKLETVLKSYTNTKTEKK